MLPWQRRMRDKQRHLKMRALSGALAVYGCILLMLFFSFYSPTERINLIVNSPGKGKGSPVLFMTGGRKNAGAKKGPVKKAASRKIVKKVVKKPTPKKLAPKKKPIPKKVVPPKPKPKPKPTPKKPVKKVEPKKTPPKKVVKQPVIKKPAPKPKPKPKPKVTPKPVSKKEIKKEPVKKVEPKPEPEPEPKKVEEKNGAPEPLVEETVVEDVQEKLHVGEGYAKGTKAQIALSRAVGRVWKPPHGLGDKFTARLSVQVKIDGTIGDVVIEKKSGVTAYDMSARAALWRTDYPRDFWGKTITVAFGAE